MATRASVSAADQACRALECVRMTCLLLSCIWAVAWNGTYYGPQFEPVGGYPGKYASEGIYTYGFGNNQGQNAGGQHLFTIVDQVQVPQDIDPGYYVLSHRYDCEQTTRERSPTVYFS